MASSINASTSAGVVTTADTSGVLNIQTAGTTAISIDASQAVSFTNSPTVTGGTANGVAYLNGSKVLTTGSALVFDGSNLGVGVTPSAWNQNRAIDLGYSGANYASIAYRASTNGTIVANNLYLNSSDSWIYKNTATAGLYQIIGGAHYWARAVSGTGGTSADSTLTTGMLLDASGNLGLGTTPSAWGSGRPAIEMNSSVSAYIVNNNTGALQLQNNSYYNGTTNVAKVTGAGSAYSQYQGNHVWYSMASVSAGATQTFSQNMTLDSSGNLLVGTTSVINRGVISLKFTGGATNNGITTQPSVNQFYNPAVFQNFSGADTGYIQVNAAGTVTTFGTSSDYRLKNNPQRMVGALAKVMQLNPCTYTWKSDGSDGQGFIAHELQAIVPDAVIGEKDAVYADGKIKPQGIDTSFLVATLTAAIQEMKALIDTQASTITQLQADVAALKGA